MNYTLQLIGCGMAVGLGVWLLVRSFAPSHPRLGTAIANLGPRHTTAFQATRRAARTGAGHVTPSSRDRVGQIVQRQVGGIPGFAAPTADLELLGQSTARFYGDKTVSAMMGLLTPTLVGVSLSLMGVGLPFFIPAALGLGLAGFFWFLPDLSVKAAAARARTDFAYAAVSYLRLVAIRRMGSAGLVSSMQDAARISDAWMFRRIHEELTLAHYARATPWDALEALSIELQVPELAEIADITRLSESGATVTSSLLARAASLRDRLISAEHLEATKATTALSVPVTALVGVFLLTMLYPAAIALLG